jgi:uncharacterized protein (DUF488 family)
MKIYTIGHSIISLEEFIDILNYYKIQLVIDVRRFPSSKKFPWFNKEFLKLELKKKDINYIHFPELGGFRKEGYETFSKTEEFKQSLNKLLEKINDFTSVILCTERFFWRCHRKFIADELYKQGIEVVHIIDKHYTYEHKLSKDLEEKMKIKIFCDKIKK